MTNVIHYAPDTSNTIMNIGSRILTVVGTVGALGITLGIIIFIIVSGYKYLTGNGSVSGFETLTKIFVALMALGLIFVLSNWLGLVDFAMNFAQNSLNITQNLANELVQ